MVTRALALIQLLLLAAVVGCPTLPTITPRPPPKPGAGCADACDRMRLIQCELGEATPSGYSCEEVCENTAEGSPTLAWDTECLATADACDACDEEDDEP